MPKNTKSIPEKQELNKTFSGKTALLPVPFCAVACIFVAVSAMYAPENLTLIFSVLCVALVIAFYKFKSTVVPIIIILVMLLASVMSLSDIEDAYACRKKTVFVNITVLEEPKETQYGNSAVVKIASDEKCSFNGKMLVYFDDVTLEAGGKYKAVIKFKPIEQNHEYYYSQEIYSHGSIKGEPKLVGEDRFIKALCTARKYIKDALYKNVSKNEAATINALTVGEKDGFSEEFYTAVRRAGVSHVMVVSGMHLAIIMQAALFLVDRFYNNKLFRAVVTVGVVLAVCSLCGFTVSILRAGITYLLMVASPFFRRENDSLNILCLAAIIIMFDSPFAVFGASFQLSVLSTLGILVVAPYFLNAAKIYLPKNAFCSALITSFIITNSATLLTLPITIWHFQEVSLVAAISNLLISFAVTTVLVCSLIALALNLLPVISYLSIPLFWVAEKLTVYINFVIETFGGSEKVVLTAGREWSVVAVILAIGVVFLLNFNNRMIYIREIVRIRKKEKEHGGFV